MIISDEERAQMLTDLDNIHNPDEVEDPYGDFVDSVYQTRLDQIYLDKVRTGKVKLVMKFEVVSGQYQGRTVTKWSNMETVQNLDFLTNDLKRLGIKQFKWATVESQFKNILDHFYEIELVTKGGYQNVYIRKEIQLDLKQKEEPPMGETKPAQKPFRESLFSKNDVSKDDIPF